MVMCDESLWAKAEFGHLNFGNRTRTRRGVAIAAAAARLPSASFPDMFPDWTDLKATYAFFSSEHVSHRELLRSHNESTAERCRGRRRILLLGDTTDESYGGWARLESGELGPIDAKGKVAGILVHTGFAVDAETHEVLGILSQEVWTRPKKTHAGESKTARLKRKRESAKWAVTQAGAAAQLAALGEEAPHVVAVHDREGDVFEAISDAIDLGHGFVVRAAQNRSVDSDEPEIACLLDALAEAPIRGVHAIVVPRGPKKPERMARLVLRAATVDILPPRDRGRAGSPLVVGVVSAIEEDPPPGEEPIHWVLLTSLPVATKADVLDVLRCYEARWIIEEFHMGLKTGCSIEKRQLKTFHALKNVLAMFSVIAVRLLVFRDCARRPDAPAGAVLGDTLMEVLVDERPKLAPNCNARDALRAIANMGGFIGRKSDGEPGWRTLWKGFSKLLLIAHGWERGRKSG